MARSSLLILAWRGSFPRSLNARPWWRGDTWLHGLQSSSLAKSRLQRLMSINFGATLFEMFCRPPPLHWWRMSPMLTSTRLHQTFLSTPKLPLKSPTWSVAACIRIPRFAPAPRRSPISSLRSTARSMSKATTQCGPVAALAHLPFKLLAELPVIPHRASPSIEVTWMMAR